ncbi:SDR family oxidoreductase [Streptantibioticus cattleyicolor]|uniref:Oxidoreductase, short chain dehydrogenase/reductase family n=1 Tax=Streptantibioticus cattleyicolor (strain ATCC 35852 / DSM 46488 / JCM 4925 / NBRC 14057 / NRRL 8057) TaxID=1003195 RepID=F8JJ28_STREN|nr:SDR family oxidoreductase [Streptantibioticus cattleyicolor]AEW98879.1 oxidoreductase, short chain dehydrogenase/reductase family [Streptantibioticus cattleyicolor NRRL 8057 = DSM 46488]CCB72074.1 putative 3-oxoacyl-[acyl-carrier-protein] reductase [Streptantibioticus cattleyicolor NRRL 8057 = DSM 46488]
MANIPDRTLRGKAAFVGGASRNLGALISRTLAAEGVRVAVHYNSDSSAAQAQQVVDDITASGGDAFALQADLTRVDQVERAFDQVVERFGRLDHSVNTAGMVLKKPLAEVDEAEYDRMFAVNAKAAFFTMRAAARRIEDGGKIVTVVTSLLAAFTGLYSVYAGSKAPVEHFTRALAKEMYGRNVSVVNIAPGPMDTSFFYPVESPEAIAFHKSSALNGELTRIEDIVPWVVFLLTDGWWATGQTFFVNGGYTTR